MNSIRWDVTVSVLWKRETLSPSPRPHRGQPAPRAEANGQRLGLKKTAMTTEKPDRHSACLETEWQETLTR